MGPCSGAAEGGVVVTGAVVSGAGAGFCGLPWYSQGRAGFMPRAAATWAICKSLSFTWRTTSSTAGT